MEPARDIFSYRKYWASRLTPAPVLPMTRAEMERLGWDECDVILVTGDAYVDHPSFGMALVGRVLESQGFRVGIVAQPDWRSADAFRALGRPKLFFGITAGNMDSMVNRYTADRRIRSDDAYTPGAEPGKRPDHAVIVYAQRAREAYNDAPVVIGGIEASLRRIAHFDYWSDTVRRSILFDAKADLLVFGNAERQIVEIAHRLAAGEAIENLTDIRGTAFTCREIPDGWQVLDQTGMEMPASNVVRFSPKSAVQEKWCREAPNTEPRTQGTDCGAEGRKATHTVVRLPGYEDVKNDRVLYAHASRNMHLETNPGNARALVQRHGDRELWLNPPPIPLTTKELDRVYELPYTRLPHPAYGDARIPAYEMIRFSVNIMRGCFGGCTFCSITEHEGRIIQSRSEESVVREIETLRDSVPGFTGVVSDVGGPTANMYRIACKSRDIEAACRKPSCVYPDICQNLNTDHSALIQLYRRVRAIPGVKKVLVASGVRYDLASRSPQYVKELVTHHVGGYLKIAPEHTEPGPLSKMMKPGIGAYDRFKQLFEMYSKEAGKEQYLIPYFIAAHPGTTDADMLQLALWLKKNGFRADQVQTFLPSPMATATAMYHSGKNPLHKVTRTSEDVAIPQGLKVRRLHKAFLRYHDPANWPTLRAALKRMGRPDLIGPGRHQLIPAWQPAGTADLASAAQGKRFLTRHTGLPPVGTDEPRRRADTRIRNAGGRRRRPPK